MSRINYQDLLLFVAGFGVMENLSTVLTSRRNVCEITGVFFSGETSQKLVALHLMSLLSKRNTFDINEITFF